MTVPIPESVLFVCTANQCRSAAAEYLMRRRLDDSGLAMKVASAGVSAWPDVPALPDTVTAARDMGVDLRDHRSQAVTVELLEGSRLVLCMARRHVAMLCEWFPAAAPRIHLLRPYCLDDATAVQDVDDPVGMPLEVHRACLHEIDTLLARLVDRWRGAA